MDEETSIAELMHYKKRDFTPYIGLILHRCRLGEAQARAFARDVSRNDCYEFSGVKFGNSEWEIVNSGSHFENFFEGYHIGVGLAGIAALTSSTWLPILKEGIERVFN